MRSLLNFQHFITPAAREIQIYIEPPSQFLIDNQWQLLPTWDKPITYGILILQKSCLSLIDNNPEVAQEKNYLREQFLRFGGDLVEQLRDRGFESDLFDPRSGYPVFSNKGSLTLNDNGLVHALLGFRLIPYQNCSLLIHPQWQTAVYPSTVVSTASSTILKSTLSEITTTLNYKRSHTKYSP